MCLRSFILCSARCHSVWSVIFLCQVFLAGCKDDTPVVLTFYKQGAPQFSESVQRVLNSKIELIQKLVSAPEVVDEIIQSNVKNKEIGDEEIQNLDTRWRHAIGVDDFIRPYLANRCSQFLITFQNDHKGFPEIFVTDIKGLNVCQTNKTTDCFQADEDWWQNAFHDGKGNSYFGDIEYDESSSSEAISIFVPVYQSSSESSESPKKLIGVAKAVVDLLEIKREL